MHVQVLFFGMLKDLAGSARESVELAEMPLSATSSMITGSDSTSYSR